jgi:hypothetical protein
MPMSEFESSQEERFGNADIPASLPLKKIEAVLKHERAAQRWSFIFAVFCVLVVIVVHILRYDLEHGKFELSTEWGFIKGGIGIAILVLAGLSVYRGTHVQITIRK